jgi:hypothetical protein
MPKAAYSRGMPSVAAVIRGINIVYVILDVDIIVTIIALVY